MVPYTHATRCTQRYTTTHTHWNNVIHFTRMHNCPSHADVRFGAFRCHVLMHVTGFRVFYFEARCGSRYSSKGFHCGFLFKSPHDIPQSMGKWKYEFAHDGITDVQSTKLLKELFRKFPMHKASYVILWLGVAKPPRLQIYGSFRGFGRTFLSKNATIFFLGTRAKKKFASLCDWWYLCFLTFLTEKPLEQHMIALVWYC